MVQAAPPTSTAARRVGYGIGAAVNAVLLYLVNVRPGWDALPFLTEETPQVLDLVNVSLAAGLVANLVYVAVDRPVVKSLGDLVTTAIALAVCVRLWQVFPFDFSDWWFDATVLVRVLLVLGIVGSLVGVVVQVVALLRHAAGGADGAGS